MAVITLAPPICLTCRESWVRAPGTTYLMVPPAWQPVSCNHILGLQNTYTENPPFVGLKNNLNSSIKGLILTKDHCVIPSGCCFTCLVSTQALRRRLQQQQRCWLSPGDLQPSQLRDRRKSKKWKGRSGKI